MRVRMRILVFLAFAVIAASETSGAAAKKTRDECMQLASQRGFNGSGDKTQAAIKKAFLISCMQVKLI